MSKTRLVRDELRYLLFSEIYHRLQVPKAQRKALLILEAAITRIARSGFDALTLEMIAREAGVTRPVVRYYFASVDEIRLLAVKYVRLVSQRVILEGIIESKSPSALLESYVEQSYRWVDAFKTHARVWLAFYSKCSSTSTFRAVNDESVMIARQRLKAILRLGAQTEEFAPRGSLDDTAQALLTFIKGSTVAYISETVPSRSAYVAFVKQHVLLLAGAKLSATDQSICT